MAGETRTTREGRIMSVTRRHGSRSLLVVGDVAFHADRAVASRTDRAGVRTAGRALALAAGLALVGAPSAWSMQDSPRASVSVAHDGAVPTSPSPALERWQVDAQRSTIGFDGTSTLHDFTGKTRSVAGEIRFEPDAIGACAGGAVWIEARTLDTDSTKRDTDMRSTLGVDEFPQIVFRLDRVEGRMVERRGEFTGYGRFFIHGYEQSKVVHFRTEPTSDGALRVLGEAHVKLSEHDLKPPSVLFVTVGDDVRVWLDLTLVRVPDAIVDAVAHDVVVATQVTVVNPTRDSQSSAKPSTAVAAGNRETRGRLLVTPEALLWERADVGDPAAPTSMWAVARGGRVDVFDAAHASPRGARRSEGGADATKDDGTRDRAKPAAQAPIAPAPITLERRDVDSRTVVVLVDGRECVTLEGLEGQDSFAALLPALGALADGFPDGIPDGLTDLLRGVRGLPTHVHVRTICTTASTGTVTRDSDVRIESSSQPAQLRTWALEPATWLRPPETHARRLFTEKDWRASQKDDP